MDNNTRQRLRKVADGHMIEVVKVLWQEIFYVISLQWPTFDKEEDA